MPLSAPITNPSALRAILRCLIGPEDAFVTDVGTSLLCTAALPPFAGPQPDWHDGLHRRLADKWDCNSARLSAGTGLSASAVNRLLQCAQTIPLSEQHSRHLRPAVVLGQIHRQMLPRRKNFAVRVSRSFISFPGADAERLESKIEQ